MKEMLTLMRGALLFDTNTFAGLKASPDVFRKGFTVLLVVGLIVGFVTGLVAMIQGLTTDPVKEMDSALAAVHQSFGQFMPSDASAQFLQNFEMGMNIGRRIITETQAPLPRQFEVIFQQVGVMVSYPFGWLGSLLSYGVLVHLIARLLGGKGTIAQMFGLTSLAVVPHLLDVLAWVPCLGAVLGLVGWGWGVGVYIKGTSVAQEMSIGKATLAVLMPILVVALLSALFIALVLILIALGGGGR